jgi:hypothetical protein
MGDTALRGHCERFIEEFGKDIIESYGLKTDWVQKQFLGECEVWHEVYLFVLAQAGEETVALMLESPIFFAADEPEEDAIDRVMELLELDRETAMARLQRAELLSR